MFRPPRRILWLVVIGLFGAMLGAFVGCTRSSKSTDRPITNAAKGTPTFSRDVAPIVFAKCASCHRPGEAAPFSLLTYDDVRSRAKQIVDVTQKRFMPPWPPDDGHGDFEGVRRLSDQELQALADWAESDLPRGSDADLPSAPEFADGWQFGTPDLVLESPEYTLSAGGSDQFRNFVIPIELKTPRWVEAVELRPTNPRITHHARLGIDTSYESARRDAEDGQPGYGGMAWGEDPDGQLVIWAPGMVVRRGTSGAAWRLQPKTCLVLHTHLQPSGKTEKMQFRIGLHFTDKPPTVRPFILRIGSRDIDIPAGAAWHTVVNEFELPVAVDVHSIFPHAHSLCKEVRVHAEQADGTRQPLIWIKHFDENWHDQYRYVKPVRLPRGTKLVTEFSYDNTDANVRNRHRPPERTVYGSNAADEMQDVYLQVTTVQPDERAALLEDFRYAEDRSKLVGYRKTLEVYPQDPWSLEGLAASYLALGKPQDAIRELDERLRLGPTEIHSLAILGMAHLAGGDSAVAEKLLRQSIGMDNAYPFSWLGLGKTLAAEQKFGEADEAFRRALELAPALTDAHLERATLLMKQGKLDEAAAACDAAIKSAPDQANALLKLAEIRTRQGRYDESLHLLEVAQQLAPYTHPPKVLLAAYCFQSGVNGRARELLTEAHAEQPKHPVPALFLGQLARQEKHLDDARSYFESAASLPTPTNWPASHRKRFLILLHSERLQLAEQLQDEPLARDALANWLRVEPENEKVRTLYKQFQPRPNP